MSNPSSLILESYKSILSNNLSELMKIGFHIPIPHFSESILSKLIFHSTQILQNRGLLIHLKPPIIVVGDLHGSLHDLLRIFFVYGTPAKTKYLFLGDYIDRGPLSLEVITLLYAFFVEYPESIFLLRGNHEFSSLNSQYGFKSEIEQSKYSNLLWEQFNESFSYLPLSAIIGKKIFCVHGGISPFLDNINQIESLSYPIIDFSNPLVSDLVWSDPTEKYQLFSNSSRGNGSEFGLTALNLFLEKNKFTNIIRAHQCVTEGYSFRLLNQIITVFSASSYDINFPNKSGLLFISLNNNINTINFSELPPVLRSLIKFENFKQKKKNYQCLISPYHSQIFKPIPFLILQKNKKSYCFLNKY